jgi:hypothetical protein
VLTYALYECLKCRINVLAVLIIHFNKVVC